MDDNPTVSVTLPIHSITLYQSDDGVWCIQDKESGVATQGDTKYEALLMLADALVGYDDADIDLLESAEDIFTLSDEQKDWLEKEGFLEEMREDES